VEEKNCIETGWNETKVLNNNEKKKEIGFRAMVDVVVFRVTDQLFQSLGETRTEN